MEPPEVPVSMLSAQEYEETMVELAGFPARIRSYRIATQWWAKVDNVNPGAIVARGGGSSRDAAVAEALGGASVRFELTRRVELL